MESTNALTNDPDKQTEAHLGNFLIEQSSEAPPPPKN